MSNIYWNIKEPDIRKYLPYFNIIFVLYIFINDLLGYIISLIGQAHFFLYFLGLLVITILSSTAWLKSVTKQVWISRVLVLVSLIFITSHSLNPLSSYLFHMQTIGILLWQRTWKDFLLTTCLLNLILTCSFLLNPFLKGAYAWWGISLFINFLLAYSLYYYSQNIKKLNQLSKIFKIMLNTTNNGIQFIDKKGQTQIINPAAEFIYNRKESDINGKYDWELYYQGKKFDEQGNYTSLITESLETGKIHKNTERIIKNEQGKQKVFLVETFRVYDDDEDEIIGAMGIYRDITAQKEMERDLLEANYEMANMAVTDELTKLYNVRYFRQRLTTELGKAYDSHLSLLIIDIDYFKVYNDLYGHLEGDKVLKEIGKILKESFRSYDIVSRYGGEEFTVILPGMDKERAKEVAERIRIKIKEAEVPGEEKLPGGKLTVTIGVSSFPEDATNVEELIEIADNALYHGKYIKRDVVITSLVG